MYWPAFFLFSLSSIEESVGRRGTLSFSFFPPEPFSGRDTDFQERNFPLSFFPACEDPKTG